MFKKRIIVRLQLAFIKTINNKAINEKIKAKNNRLKFFKCSKSKSILIIKNTF